MPAGSRRGHNHAPALHLGSGHGPLTPGAGAVYDRPGEGWGQARCTLCLSRTPGSSSLTWGRGAPQAGASVQCTTVKTAGRTPRPTPPSWGICLSSCEAGRAIVTSLTHYTQHCTPKHSQTGRQSWPAKQARNPGCDIIQQLHLSPELTKISKPRIK